MSNDNMKKISNLSLVAVISGIVGWLYEFIFYYFNDGRFTFQGGNFLPWINIYAIGGVMLVLLTYKLRKNPFKVFLIACLSTGILEYISGFLIYKIGNGTRYWDYNTEILNFGNINGFICFRSVFVFGLSSLLLIYVICPLLIKISNKVNIKKYYKISLLILSIFLIDEFYNLVSLHLLNLPTAKSFYTYLNFK